jgi:predicted nucleotidyltransferase
MTEQDKTFLSQIKQTMLAIEPSAEVVLFGSRARGDFHAESDWDLIVLSDKPKITIDNERQIRHALFQIELDYQQSISLMIYPKRDWNGKMSVIPLHQSVQKEGILL